jgi:hypothetical protein
MKVTVPVGVAPDPDNGATVAVNVTPCVAYWVAGLDTNVVLLAVVPTAWDANPIDRPAINTPTRAAPGHLI